MILRHLLFASLIYVSLVLQSSIGNDCTFHGFRPWFPAIASTCCVLLSGEVSAIVWCSLLGLGVDCLSGDRLGVNLIAATFVATAVELLLPKYRTIGSSVVGMHVLGITLIWKMMATSIQGLFLNQTVDGPRILWSALGDGIYSAALVFATYFGIRLLKISLISSRTGLPIPITNRWFMLTK